MAVRIDHVVTSGTFALDGETFDVDNNVWVIACTHANDDHVRVAPALAAATGAPVLLHPVDAPVWALTHPDAQPDGTLSDGQVLTVAGADVRVIHTPGHAPGCCCFYLPALGVVFSGDTLFAGGPGATGRSFSDFPTLTASIRSCLLTLPADTSVHTGHGDSTTIGEAAGNIDAWEARGH